MPRKTTSCYNFVKEQLAANPRATLDEVKQAWIAAGHSKGDWKSNPYPQMKQYFAKHGHLPGSKLSPTSRTGSRSEPSSYIFIKEKLAANSAVTIQAIRTAWFAAGYSQSGWDPRPYYQMRRKVQETGPLPGNGTPADEEQEQEPRARKLGRPAKQQSTTRDQKLYQDIEQTLDHLVQQADKIQDSPLAAALRQARRHVGKSLLSC